MTSFINKIVKAILVKNIINSSKIEEITFIFIIAVEAGKAAKAMENQTTAIQEIAKSGEDLANILEELESLVQRFQV